MERTFRCAPNESTLAIQLICLLALVLSGPASGGEVHRQRIDPDVLGLEGAAISPDGLKVAIISSGYGDQHKGLVIPSHLEVRDVLSRRVDASLNLLILPAGHRFAWSQAMSRVRYCDHGKYILIYGANGTFYVVDVMGYQIAATITVPVLDSNVYATPVVLAASCAAEADIAAIVVVARPGDKMASERSIRIFSLDTGKQQAEIRAGSDPSTITGVAVSSSGATVLVYATCINDRTCRVSSKIAVLDTKTSESLRWIDAEFRIGQAAFVGDSSIAVAVAAASFQGAYPDPVIKIFDARTGVFERQIGDRMNAPHEIVEASADGRFLFAYTGKENHCEDCGENSRGHLVIPSAKFAVWDLTTGKIVAKSKIPVSTVNGLVPMLWGDPDGKHSERPRLQFSQSGNAVVSVKSSYLNQIDVYRW